MCRRRHAANPSYCSRTLHSCNIGFIGSARRLARWGETPKNRAVRVPTAKQEVIPTDRTPTDRNNCLAIAHALNEQAKTLSKRTKQGVPREFTRVASDLDASCGEEDFGKAWISIEWMNGCLNNFTKDYELGFCSKNVGYACAIAPRSDACLNSR